jgi:4-amino-4-deoxy-L-arabinose transferase-like glycosyltransferase
MQDSDQTIPSAAPDRDASLRLVWLVVLGALAARVIYLVWVCRYELVEDEAQYWLWAQYPGWSYSTKGPGVAWAIWLSTHLFGNAEWAVRLPTAIASAIGALAVGALARDLSVDARGRAPARGERVEESAGWATPAMVGGLSALAYTLAPALQAAGILMTIDGGYVACWAVACWAFWRAQRAAQADKDTDPGLPIAPDDPMLGWHWALVGLAVAVGFLFKYTMLLLVPGLIVFACVRPRGERRMFVAMSQRAWFALGIVLAVLGLVPVILWNSRHEWATVAHLLGHLGMQGGDVPIAPGEQRPWSPLWLPELLVQQLGMIGPWLVLAAMGWRTMRPEGRWRDDPRWAGQCFLICAAAPILVFYTIVALIAEPEGNWPMAAYTTLMPLAAWAAADAIAERAARRARGDGEVPRRVRRRVMIWNLGLWYAIIAALPVHFLDRFGDAALALNHQPWFENVFRKTADREPRDPAGRVRGGKAIAMHVSELLRGLEERTGKEGFVLCQHYGRASQIAYYIPARFTPAEQGTEAGSHTSRRKEKPLVLCAMHETGGRKSQFDYWERTDLNQVGIMGHPAVVVSSTRPEIYWAFKRMFDQLEDLPGGQRLRGESKPDRSAFLGIGYKGTAEAIRAVREAQEKEAKARQAKP